MAITASVFRGDVPNTPSNIRGAHPAPSQPHDPVRSHIMTDQEARAFLPMEPKAQAIYQLSRDLGDPPLVALRSVLEAW